MLKKKMRIPDAEDAKVTQKEYQKEKYEEEVFEIASIFSIPYPVFLLPLFFFLFASFA